MGRVRALLLPLAALFIVTLPSLRNVHAEAAAQSGAAAGSQPSEAGPQTLIYGDWRISKPGVRHHITLDDLPPPYETRSAGNPPEEVRRPGGAVPQAPEGFAVQLFAEGLEAPRMIRAAPNGDLFVAETGPGNIRILRPSEDRKSAAKNVVYASGLSEPFGIAFYPKGPEPKWVYVAESNRVIRFAYTAGDLQPRSKPETIVAQLATNSGGHITRDLVFSNDGAQMFVSVGSATNDAEGMPRKTPEQIEAWQAAHGLGAAWDFETDRADVLVFTPEGKDRHTFATGLRNCVGLAVQPMTGELYCSTNERDGLGDNLPPDYVTRVSQGEFFGWPWWYMGNHEDPRWKGARPDLSGKITNPQVLLQPHSAPLAMTFYDGTAFPEEYRGSAFVAFHGSWNRTKRTGYKVVRVLMHNGEPTGEYEDFLTGFVIDNDHVWGRPVGVTVGKDGALYVTEDANGTVWRVAYSGRK
ncbi:MAG: PQQ-dependent sugar dehydrogenase [Rhodomicrobium sp.]